MSSSGDQRTSGLMEQVPQDLDWASLVREMREIKDNIQNSLEKSEANPISVGAEPAESTVLVLQPSAPGDAPMEEMLSSLPAEEETGEAKGAFAASQNTGAPAAPPDAHAHPENDTRPSATVLPFSAPRTAAPESALSLAVIGALKLKLELTRQSQTVQIHIEETELRVELSDGMQFRIPLNKAA